MKNGLQAAAFVAIALTAQAARATPDCMYVGGCNPLNPPIPVTQAYGGNFHYGMVDGFVSDTYKTQTSIIDPPVPIGPNGATFGNASAGGTLRTQLQPIASTAVAAYADGSVAGYVEMFDQFLYRVEFYPLPGDAYATMAALSATGQAVGTIHASYSLSASGAGSSSAYLNTGGALAGGVSVTLGSSCDTGPNAGGCGAASIDVPLVVRSGDHFRDAGDPHVFYGVVSMYVDAKIDANLAGGAMAFLDPSFHFAPSLAPYAASIPLILGANNDVSNLSPGGVPEPASWALLVAGFGLVGTFSRRRALAHG